MTTEASSAPTIFGEAVSTPKEEGVKAGMSTLPIEMLENIARYLPDKDLRAFGQTDSTCRNVALKERTLRVLTTAKGQVGLLSNLNPIQRTGESSPIRWCIAFFAEIRRHELESGAVFIPIHQPALELLNQSLRAITTERLADRILGLKNEIFQEINAKTINWDDINQIGQELQVQSLLEVLNAIILASPQADWLRTLAVGLAAQDDHINIAQGLLENGTIVEECRDRLVEIAASRGHVEILQTLLANGPISQQTRDSAVCLAAESGRREILQTLLANGPISQQTRGVVVMDAARHGYLEIVQALLGSGSISLSQRFDAIKAALQNGHYRIASELLPAKAILMTAFLGLTAAYINSLQYQEEK